MEPYNPDGPYTWGADWARDHPGDAPDGALSGPFVKVGSYKMQIANIRRDGLDVILDAREIPPQELDSKFYTGASFSIDGLPLEYFVKGIHGVFIVASVDK